MRISLSLGQQNALRLALIFVVFEALSAIAVIYLLMLPMAHRAANDLAGLMVLSAQTWSELPPHTRPAFEYELASSHGLALAARLPPGPEIDHPHNPYLNQLEAELIRRAGPDASLVGLEIDGKLWRWSRLPSGGRTLWVGFSQLRFDPQPVAAAAVSLTVALLLAGIAAWWLSRRIAAPLERFDAAAAALGRGETPALLPESGPRELAALARRFNEMASQVRELLDARTTLLAGLSHDLRTPLARMRLALEMLQRRPDPAWVARLDKDIDEMNRLIGDLLELARGLGQETATRLDLAPWLEDIAAQARDTGVNVTVQAPAIQVEVPPTALRRVLENYLGNARRYAPGSPLEIRVEADGNGTRIGVLDQGPGIPKEQLAAVFQPFHRVEGSRSQATGGTGLGLAIVRQLAQANGWRVWLENRPSGGLAAWVALKPAPADPAA